MPEQARQSPVAAMTRSGRSSRSARAVASDSGRSLEMPLRAGGVRFIRLDEFGVRKGAGQQRVQVIEQKIAVVFAVPAQDHALARDGRKATGPDRRAAADRSIRSGFPHVTACSPRAGKASTKTVHNAIRRSSDVDLLRFFGKKGRPTRAPKGRIGRAVRGLLERNPCRSRFRQYLAG